MKRLLSLLLLTALIIPQTVSSQNCLLAHFPLNGNAIDSSGNNVPAVVNGPVPAMDRFGNPNGAMRFDGVDDFIEINNDSPIITTDTFTISMWAKMTGEGGGTTQRSCLFQQRNQSNNPAEPKIVLFSDNRQEIRMTIEDDQGDRLVFTHPMVTDSAWHCYTFVRTGSDSVFIYLDGQIAERGYWTSSGSFTTNIDFVELGVHRFSGSTVRAAFKGCMDDVRFYSCPLSHTEITAMCNAQSQNSDTACLAVDFPLDGTAVDVSGNNVFATVSGAVPGKDRFGNPNGSMKFDGVDDYIELNGNAAILDSGAFTVVAWAKMMGQGGGVDNSNPLFQQRGDNTAAGISKLLCFIERQSNDVSFRVFDEVGNAGTTIGSASASDTNWHCYTYVYTTSNYMYIYVDGIQVAQGPSNETGFWNVNIDHVTIGSHRYLGQLQGAFNGYIDDFKIYNCELDSSEVVAVCNEQSPTADTACLLADYHLDGNGADSSGNGFTGVVNGPVPTIDRFGNAGGAMRFDGVDDYIELNSNQAIIDSGEFTVLAYAKILGTGGGVDNTNPIFQQRADGTSAGTSKMVLFAERQNNEMALALFDEVGASGSSIDYPKVQDTSWHCYAFVHTGNSWMYIYLDGIQVAQGPSAESGFFDVGINHVTIGSHNYLGQLQGAFNGCIDDVKIYQCALDSAEIAAVCKPQNTGLGQVFPLNESISIYPNPASDYLHIKIQSEDYDMRSLDFSVVDAIGQELKLVPVGNKLDVSNLSRGVYMFVVRDKNGALLGSQQFLK